MRRITELLENAPLGSEPLTRSAMKILDVPRPLPTYVDGQHDSETLDQQRDDADGEADDDGQQHVAGPRVGLVPAARAQIPVSQPRLDERNTVADNICIFFSIMSNQYLINKTFVASDDYG